MADTKERENINQTKVMKVNGNRHEEEFRGVEADKLNVNQVDKEESAGGGAQAEYELVPPDGGWGWLVLAGSMMVNILIPGTIKSFGVLFVEFLEAFEASSATAAWIPALCYFLYSSLGPVSSILSIKYSYRTVTFMGGTSAALGMIASYWASSVTYLYLSYGVLVGIGAGLSFPPPVYIVTSYFVKLRGLANGLCISGSALGSIILPPILRWLLETYGYRGAVLIMGGVTLNVFVAAIFYEPVERHMIRVPIKDDAKQLPDIEEEDIGIVLRFETGVQETNNTPELKRSEITTNTITESNQTFLDEEGMMVVGNDVGGDQQPFIRSVSANVMQNCIRNNREEFQPPSGQQHPVHHHPLQHQSNTSQSQHSSRIRKISTPVRLPQRNQTFTTGGQLNSQSSLYAVPECRQSGIKLERLNNVMRNNSSKRLTRPSPSTSSFQYISTPYHGSTLSFQPKEFSSHLSLKSVLSGGGGAGGGVGGGGDGGDAPPPQQSSHLHYSHEFDELQPQRHGERERGERDHRHRSSSRFFDLSLLKDPTYLVILISNSTNAIGYTNFIILLPAYGIKLGFNKSLAAYLISIVSATDLIGRIGGSALSDLEFIPKTWYFIGGLAFSGISLILLPFCTSYEMVSFWCAAFGLASGVYVGITAVIMADLLGTERLTSSYGISLFVNGILQLIGPPLCGFWYEYVHNYSPLFHTLGLILVAGSSLWSFMPLIHRRRTKLMDNMEDYS